MLVDLIARKMRQNGYTIVALEGSLLSLPESEKMPIPWTIKRHRPDVIGINLNSIKVCIGEAKTSDDLFSERTASQLTDFAQIIGKSGQKTELVIGVPLRSEGKLRELLRRLNVPEQGLSVVVLPEELAINENEGFL
jgi:hypothetical protein